MMTIHLPRSSLQHCDRLFLKVGSDLRSRSLAGLRRAVAEPAFTRQLPDERGVLAPDLGSISGETWT